MRLISRRPSDAEKRWPAYVLGGRMRASTLVLIVAFFLTAWLYDTYKPPPPEPAPATQTVPPGFVPDPEYTWVPRTQVQEWTRTTTPTTTTPTTTTTVAPPTTTTPTTPTEPTDTPAPGQETPVPAEVTPPTTTVIDPDGPNGLLPPITLPVLPGAAPAPAPQTPATPPPPARSGY
jgi:hypothetical protein